MSYTNFFGLPRWLSSLKKKKNLPANAGDTEDAGSIPRSGRSPGEGNGNPLQYSCLKNPMSRGAWWATVQKSCKELGRHKFLSHLVSPTRWASSQLHLPQTQPSCISLGSWDGGVTCVLPLSFVHPSLCTWLCSLLLASPLFISWHCRPRKNERSLPVLHGTLHLLCHSSLPGHLACVSFSAKKIAFSGAQSIFFSAITRTQHVLWILQKWIFGALWTPLGVRWEGRRSKNRDRA